MNTRNHDLVHPVNPVKKSCLIAANCRVVTSAVNVLLLFIRVIRGPSYELRTKTFAGKAVNVAPGYGEPHAGGRD